ncbi:MAG: hypothetical protein AAGI28_15235, partial [Pseudomonadota bacterium]
WPITFLPWILLGVLLARVSRLWIWTLVFAPFILFQAVSYVIRDQLFELGPMPLVVILNLIDIGVLSATALAIAWTLRCVRGLFSRKQVSN